VGQFKNFMVKFINYLLLIVLIQTMLVSYGIGEEVKSISKHNLLGRFIKIQPGDKRNIIGHDLYLVLETSKGEKMAYPVEVADIVLKDEIIANPDKDFFIEASSFEKEIIKGEFPEKVKFLRVYKGKIVKMRELGVAYDEQTYSKGKYDPKDIKVSENVTIGQPGQGLVKIEGINDTVTNAAIFIGGAAILGKILLGK